MSIKAYFKINNDIYPSIIAETKSTQVLVGDIINISLNGKPKNDTKMVVKSREWEISHNCDELYIEIDFCNRARDFDDIKAFLFSLSPDYVESNFGEHICNWVTGIHTKIHMSEEVKEDMGYLDEYCREHGTYDLDLLKRILSNVKVPLGTTFPAV